MKNSLKIAAVIMMGVLVMMAGQTVGAQEQPKGIMKDIIRMMGPDVFKSISKSMAEELAKDEEFRKQIVQQVIHEVVTALGPDGVRDILKSVASEYGHSNAVKDRIAADAGPSSAQMASALMSVAGEFIKNTSLVSPVVSRNPVTTPQALMTILQEKTGLSDPLKAHPNGEGISAPRSFRRDLVTIIAHPSNPVQTLTVDQVRKLFDGGYTNWAQLGGPDLPVKPVISRETLGVVEDLFSVPIAATGIRVPFLSFLLVGVAETEGAVGFLLTSNMEQLEFVRGHVAIKKIAIKKDIRSPALIPNPVAVIDGSYPLFAREVKSCPGMPCRFGRINTKPKKSLRLPVVEKRPRPSVTNRTSNYRRPWIHSLQKKFGT